MSNNIVYKISAVDMLSPALKNINAEADKTDKKLSSLGITSAIGFAAATAGAIAFGSAVLAAGTKVEDARVGLTTLLKDSAAANTVIERTMSDAAKTPFDFETLLSGNKALISAGASANDARKDILSLGNAIAATGGGSDELQRMVINLQQIKNIGKASGQDIKQFGYAGVNIYKLLSESTGKNVDELKKIPITYDMITESLEKAQAAGGIFAGALDKMQNNVSIKMSNVGDNFFIIFNNIFEAVKPIITTVLDGLISVLDVVKDFTSKTENMTIIRGVILGITAAVGALGLAIIATTASTWLLFIAQNAVLLGIPAGIGLIVGGLVYLNSKFAVVRGTLYALGASFKSFFKIVLEAMKLVGNFIIGDFQAMFKNSTQIMKEWSNGSLEIAKEYKKGINEVLYEEKINPFLNKAKEIHDAKIKADEANNKEELDRLNKHAQNLVKASEQVFGAKSSTRQKIHQATLIGNLNKGDKTDILPISPTKDKKLNSALSSVSGPKITTININMENMVKDISISTTNLKQGSNEIKDIIINALSQALNDSQLAIK